MNLAQSRVKPSPLASCAVTGVAQYSESANPDIRPQVRDQRNALANRGEGLLKEVESKVYKRPWADTEITDVQPS